MMCKMILYTAKVLITLAVLVSLMPAFAVEGRKETGNIAKIVSLDPRFDRLVPQAAKLEKIAEDFILVEGSVWHKSDGYLLFSDIPANRVFKWMPGAGTSLYLERSGYSGSGPFAGTEPGSNGLTFDANGRLVLCRHGDRQIGRLESNGTITPVAPRHDGHRINSPDDLVFKSNDDRYFTDPPFGLPGVFDNPHKAPVQGVYRVTKDGAVTRVIADIKAPNGIAFSPDEKTLYVSDVDSQRAAWLAYDVKADGTVTNGRVFVDATCWRKDPFFGPDGFKVDENGNLFGARPDGISVFTPDGTHLGDIETGLPPSSVAWGEDGRTLFVTCGSSVYRIRLVTRGLGY